MASNIETLFALAAPEPEVGYSIDLEKLSYDISRGFRVSTEGPGVNLGKIYVVTRLDDDLFEVELDSSQVAPFAEHGKPYFKCVVNITRSKGIWQPALDRQLTPVLERWTFRFGSQDPTEHTHHPNTGYGENLNEEEFLRKFNASQPDQEATKELKEYLQMIYKANGISHWGFNWLSEEEPKFNKQTPDVNAL